MLTGVGGQPEIRHPLRAIPLNPLSTLIYRQQGTRRTFPLKEMLSAWSFSQRKQLQNRLVFETGKTA